VNLRVLEVAQQEIDEAVSHYNAQVAGLGGAFLVEMTAAIDRIRRFPDAWHPLERPHYARRGAAVRFVSISRPASRSVA
jgi:hypothetical protein